MTTNTCGSSFWTSFMLIFRWKEFSCGIYTSLKFYSNWFTLFRIELKVNDGNIIRLCLLKETCFLYSNEQSTFTLFISLLSTTCFGWLYRLKSVRIQTIWMEMCTECAASVCPLHMFYILSPNSERDICTSACFHSFYCKPKFLIAE